MDIRTGHPAWIDSLDNQAGQKPYRPTGHPGWIDRLDKNWRNGMNFRLDRVDRQNEQRLTRLDSQNGQIDWTSRQDSQTGQPDSGLDIQAG